MTVSRLSSPEVGLEQLGDEALAAVLQAHLVVRQLDRAEVEPEHPLAALAAVPGLARELLSEAGVGERDLQRELDGVSRPSDVPVPPVPPLSAATWVALHRAADRAGTEPVDGPDVLGALLAKWSGVRLLIRAAGATSSGSKVPREGGTSPVRAVLHPSSYRSRCRLSPGAVRPRW